MSTQSKDPPHEDFYVALSGRALLMRFGLLLVLTAAAGFLMALPFLSLA